MPLLECLALVLSFLGWGAVIARPFSLKVDSGLLGAWGAAFTLAVSSVVICFWSGPFLPWVMGWTALGVVLFFSLVSIRPDAKIWRPLLGLLLLAAVGELFQGWNNIQQNGFDDWLAYLPDVRSLLETGKFSDPFSLRRAAAFGGQTVLLAYSFPGFGILHLPFMESGILYILLILLLLGWTPSQGRRSQLWLGVIIMAALMDYPRINLAAQLSSVFFLLAFFRTAVFFRSQNADRRQWVEGPFLAMSGMAFASLRAPFLVLIGAFLCLEMIFQSVSKWRSLLLYLVFALPWSWLLFQSSGTPYFPLFHGNVIALKGSMGFHGDFLYNLSRFGFGFWFSSLILLILFPLCERKVFKNKNKQNLALYLACFFVAVLLTLSLPDYPRTELDRYHHASLLVCSLVFLRSLMDREHEMDSVSKVLYFSSAGSAILFLVSGVLWMSELPWRLQDAWGNLREQTPLQTLPVREKHYLAAQQTIPSGKKFLSITDQPYLFDFRRNSVELLDIPGHAAPGGAMPGFGSYDELNQFFRSLGIDYLVFSEPKKSSGMYSLEKWLKHQQEQRADYHTPWSRQFLALFEYLDRLRNEKKILYQDGFVVAVDLREASDKQERSRSAFDAPSALLDSK
jgi:hypothetical protein